MRKPSIITHLIGIILFFSIPLVFAYSQERYSGIADLLFSPEYWFFTLYYLSIYFLLVKLIIPLLYVKGKLIQLVLVAVVLLTATVYIKPFDRLMHRNGHNRPHQDFDNGLQSPPQGRFQGPPQPGPEGNHPGSPAFDMVSIFLLLMLFLIVIAVESVKRWRATEQRAIQAEADKANAELSFLKAQINPHFLFNTLNNIYSLAITKSDDAPDAIMKLSKIMRYVTDEAHETMVPLESEIDCINNYISLQKLRLGKNITIDFSITGDYINHTIPPLVLMTFVENAFKHGVSNHEPTNIIIKMMAEGKYTHFFIQNNLFDRSIKTERTGIGIDNTKKRLHVLYGEKHLLTLNKNEKLYTVELVLYS